MIADLVAFQKAVDEFVVEPMDHSFLNKDIPYFERVVPTAENIAVYMRDRLQQPIRDIGAQLHKIKLIESPNNSCEVYCTEAIAPLTPSTVKLPELLKA
jgi:6-pyruvoyltetrahydropterin/6-carboxytetrahydropterin synthase